MVVTAKRTKRIYILNMKYRFEYLYICTPQKRGCFFDSTGLNKHENAYNNLINCTL